MGRFLYESEKTRAREVEMEKCRTNQQNPQPKPTMIKTTDTKKLNKKSSSLLDDQEAWEENRLLSSGAAMRGTIQLDFNALMEEDMNRVTLLVHQVRPPFLGDAAAFSSTSGGGVSTVKDVTSDFARMA